MACVLAGNRIDAYRGGRAGDAEGEAVLEPCQGQPNVTARRERLVVGTVREETSGGSLAAQPGGK